MRLLVPKAYSSVLGLVGVGCGSDFSGVHTFKIIFLENLGYHGLFSPSFLLSLLLPFLHSSFWFKADTLRNVLGEVSNSVWECEGLLWSNQPVSQHRWGKDFGRWWLLEKGESVPFKGVAAGRAWLLVCCVPEDGSAPTHMWAVLIGLSVLCKKREKDIKLGSRRGGDGLGGTGWGKEDEYKVHCIQVWNSPRINKNISWKNFLH